MMRFCNYWTGVMFSPKKTIRSIVKDNPNYGLFWLYFVTGFVSLLYGEQAGFKASNPSVSPLLILVSALILSLFYGWFRVTIKSLVYRFTGRFLGGKASYESLRASVAWSITPQFINLVIWFGVFWPYPTQLLSVTAALLCAVGGVWSLVLEVGMIAEVQGFSNLRAFGNFLLVALFYGLLILFISLIIATLLVAFQYRTSAGTTLSFIISGVYL